MSSIPTTPLHSPLHPNFPPHVHPPPLSPHLLRRPSASHLRSETLPCFSRPPPYPPSHPSPTRGASSFFHPSSSRSLPSSPLATEVDQGPHFPFVNNVDFTKPASAGPSRPGLRQQRSAQNLPRARPRLRDLPSFAQKNPDFRSQRTPSPSKHAAGMPSSDEENGAGGGPKSYYEVLEVPVSASAAELTKAYKKKALKCHPDRQPPSEKEAASVEFQKLAEAYDVLGNEVSRKRYDDEMAAKKARHMDHGRPGPTTPLSPRPPNTFPARGRRPRVPSDPSPSSYAKPTARDTANHYFADAPNSIHRHASEGGKARRAHTMPSDSPPLPTGGPKGKGGGNAGGTGTRPGRATTTGGFFKDGPGHQQWTRAGTHDGGPAANMQTHGTLNGAARGGAPPNTTTNGTARQRLSSSPERLAGAATYTIRAKQALDKALARRSEAERQAADRAAQQDQASAHLDAAVKAWREARLKAEVAQRRVEETNVGVDLARRELEFARCREKAVRVGEYD